jgi:phosphopantetheinyl transferase (holo-ACP synthase)
MRHSTGNDIVAMANVNRLRTGQFRFYSRILSVSEQTLYTGKWAWEGSAAIPFVNFVWLLWSVKESAYKFLKRSRPDLVFSPTKIIVQQIVPPQNGEELYRGTAIWGSELLYFQSMIRPEFIASVVDDRKDLKNSWWGVGRIDRSDRLSQSASVRSFVLDKLRSIFPGRHLQINKHAGGHPIVCSGPAELGIPVSLAHDGHYIAYSFAVLSTLGSPGVLPDKIFPAAGFFHGHLS